MLQQQLHHGIPPAIDRSLQRRISLAIPRFNRRPTIEQRPRSLHMTPARRHMERRRPHDAAARIHISPRANQRSSSATTGRQPAPDA